MPGLVLCELKVDFTAARGIKTPGYIHTPTVDSHRDSVGLNGIQTEEIFLKKYSYAFKTIHASFSSAF